MEKIAENSLIGQAESIARQAWKVHPASQPADLGDKIAASLAIEDLVQMLITHKSPAPQILNNVFIDRQEYPGRSDINTPRVSITIIREAVSRFAARSGIDCIVFETHPERSGVKSAADLRWLIVRGLNPDDRRIWETEYIFDHFETRKREKTGYEGGIWRNEGPVSPIDRVDLDLISQICLGIRTCLGKMIETIEALEK